jgi:hypothetical protein
MPSPLRITTEPADLKDGLFGNVFYHVFQILPYLDETNQMPQWTVRTSEYGEAPGYVTIPGVLDLAYEAPEGPARTMTLADLRRQQGRILGNDFATLHRMWERYFRIPQRVLDRADAALPPGRGLGLHYRGTDKLLTADDSNPFSPESFLTLVREFLEERPDFEYIFAATDEIRFVERLREQVMLPVINLGAVEFHLAKQQMTPRPEKADRALLDALLLSRCACVIESSSALPSFAKVLQPELEIYRTAASKLFQDVPYFPVAFIPILPVKRAASKAILEASLAGDWTFDPQMERFKRPFASMRRKPLRQFFLRLGYKLGADRLIRKAADLRSQHIRRRLRNG